MCRLLKKSYNLWIAEVDKCQIQQVISNITINAKQAMPKGGNLYISMENKDMSDNETISLKSGKYIKIILRDEGIGIDREHLNKIFDPYFSTKPHGNGLGLATSYSIIQNHNGHIEIDSEVGKGSSFTIYLPTSKATIIHKNRKVLIEKKILIKHAKLLIMDDEKVICKLALKMINKLGHSAECALNGVDAIEKYKIAYESGNPFDIVIMDLTIPGGMGGEEAVQEILKINKRAKVIVSSGYSDNDIMANYKDYGFSDAIPKPYNLKKLNEILQKHIDV